jgi:O-succinylbenzoic acid--CoA ligase
MEILFKTTTTQLVNDVQNFVCDWNTEPFTLTIKTSGSTGQPKTCYFTREQVTASALRTLSYFKITPGKKALLCLATDTIAGKMMMVRSLVGRLHLNVTDAVANPLGNCTEPIDFIAVVPYQLDRILHERPSSLRGIQTILVGGASISSALEEKLESHGITAYHTFGMTETITHFAVRKIGANGERNYRALEGVSFETKNKELVLNDTLLGIYAMPTGELVSAVTNDSFEWLGRKDFLINTGGVSVQPEEIEKILSFHLSSPFFIAGLPHPQLGEEVTLVMEGKEKFDPNILQQITKKFHRPRKIIHLDAFIYTRNGKLDRRATIKCITNNVPE